MRFFEKTIKNMNRFREILYVLIKYGFGEVLDRTGLMSLAKIKKPGFLKKSGLLKTEQLPNLTQYQRMVLAFQDLGPAFVKLGQILAEREDILPIDLCNEFKTLQTGAREMSFEDALKMVESSFEQSIDDLFVEFDKKPIASASIAQVHRAVINTQSKQFKSNSSESKKDFKKIKYFKTVAVKIQRPEIRDIIRIDMDIIAFIAGIIENHDPSLKAIELKKMIIRISKSFTKELDFENERKSIERFRKNFNDDKRVYVPVVYPELSCPTVLTMEFIDGLSLSSIFKNMNSDNPAKINKIFIKKIAEMGVNITLKQIFDHGYFHADPHPGNIYIIPEQDKYKTPDYTSDKMKICFIDFGMTGVLSLRDRYCLGDILLGLYNYDSKRAAKAIIKLTGYDDESTSLMEGMLESLFDKYSHININDINIDEVFIEITSMMAMLNIRIPSQMHLLIKTLITIDGVGRRLDPELNIFDHISPFAKKLIQGRLSPKKLVKDIYLATLDMTMLLKDLPFELHELLYKAKNGKLKMIYEIKNIESLLNSVEKITNRVSFSIVLAALIIGSSLIVHAKVPPLWNNIPLIGIAGYIGAGILGFSLLIDIIRNKRM